MNASKIIGGLVVAIIGTVPVFANAATLDFDTLRNKSTTGYTYVQGPYKEDGYTLSASRCQSSLGVANAGCFVAVQPYHSMDKVGASLATQLVSTTTTVSRDSGSAFSLGSIDFSEYLDNGIYGPTSTVVNFAFAFADGTSGADSRTFSTAGAYVPTTFSFDLKPLTSFSWTPITGSGVQFDNIVLNDVVAAVPEPATWGMMIVGLGVVGGSLRKRRRLSLTLA